MVDAQKRDLGDEIYYDAVVHDAQLLYLLARHFPARAERDAAGGARRRSSAAVSGNRVDSLSAAYTLLALDAFAKSRRRHGTLGITEIGKDGRERALTLPAARCRKCTIAGAPRRRCSSRRSGALRRRTSRQRIRLRSQSAGGGDRARASRSSASSSTRRARRSSRVTVGEEFLVRLRLRATDARSAAADRGRRSAAGRRRAGAGAAAAPADSSDAGRGSGVHAAARRAAPRCRSACPDKSDWAPSHVDVRDDRLVLYGDVTKNAGTFVYRVRATNAGSFRRRRRSPRACTTARSSASAAAGTLEVVKP